MNDLGGGVGFDLVFLLTNAVAIRSALAAPNHVTLS
jgi:hypothetical protein